MIGRKIKFRGNEYTVVDKATIGNNPPTYYYILDDGFGNICKMSVDRQNEKWHFEAIEHWHLLPEI
jgi:hypothetical protein